MPYFYLRTAKQLSKIAAELVSSHSLNMPHGHCIEIVAASFGFRTAASLQAKLKTGEMIVQINLEAAKSRLHSFDKDGEVRNLDFWVTAVLPEVITSLEEVRLGINPLTASGGELVVTPHREFQELRVKYDLHRQILNITEAEEITASTPNIIRFGDYRPQSHAIAVPFMDFLTKVSPERVRHLGSKLYNLFKSEEHLCQKLEIKGVSPSGNYPGNTSAYHGGMDFDISLDIRRRKIEKKIRSIMERGETGQLNALFDHYVECCEEALHFRSVALANTAFISASMSHRIPKPLRHDLDDLLAEETPIIKFVRDRENYVVERRNAFLRPYEIA